MEEKLEKLRKLFNETSNELQQWMQEDLQQEPAPAAYSIGNAMMFLRSSYMWAQDAAAQKLHFDKNVKPKLEVVK